MIYLLSWIGIGMLSGWIGHLATRTEKENHSLHYLAVGIIGAIFGGLIVHDLGAPQESNLLFTNSAFNALITSTLFVTIFAVLQNFLGKASSR